MREQILTFLEKNSKIDLGELAILLGSSEAVIANEVAQMEKEQVICGYHTLIDWEKTSSEKVTALIEVRVTPQRGQGFDSIAERIYNYPEVQSVYLISGAYDLLVILEGKTLRDVSSFVSDKLSTLDTVLSTATHFILKKYKESGQQTYVICPWIEDPKNTSGLATVEDTMKVYEKAFENTGMKIGCVTGKMKSQEIDDTISSFIKNDIQILISTTVIEVGVNVPNANIIVINNADRFGLAQLHQLRGRVGRGSDQGYCILNSKEKDNARLQIMCSTTNGYEIAQKDMELRGTGDILGTDQSGTNEFIELMLKYPNMYQKVLHDVKENVI